MSTGISSQSAHSNSDSVLLEPSFEYSSKILRTAAFSCSVSPSKLIFDKVNLPPLYIYNLAHKKEALRPLRKRGLFEIY